MKNKKIPLVKKWLHGFIKNGGEPTHSYDRPFDETIFLATRPGGSYYPVTVRNSTDKERKTYPLKRVEIDPDHPGGIEQGIYFETQITADEWNKNSMPRWLVGKIIQESLYTTGDIPHDAHIEGVLGHEKDGKVVIRVEIKQK